MQKIVAYCSLLIIAAITSLALVSCNNEATDIPFPVNDSTWPQPVSQTLQLSASKKLNWVTVKTGGIHPTIKKLDIDALPHTPYDASGFKPFAKAPEEVHFDFNALPTSPFNLDKIPSKPLHFKTSVMAPPVVTKVPPPSPRSGTPLSIYDIGANQGIRDNPILCFLKDKSGLTWIGTPTGLYRYDGEYMQKYPIKGAGCLLEDNNGRIWFRGTNGIGMIDTKAGKVSLSSAINFKFHQIPRMILDDKGNIWICQTANNYADVIDPNTETFKHLDNSTGISGTDAWGVFEDGQKNIWLTTDDGADIINPEKGTIKYLKKTNEHGSDSLMAITGDKKNRVWFAYANGGVAEVNTAKDSIINYGKLQGLDNAVTNCLLYDNLGMTWIGTSQGLSILDPDKGMVKTFTVNEGIAPNLIFNLLQDDQQRVWVAEVNAPLSIIDQNAKVVYPVGKKVVTTLFEDAAGNIWMGTNNEGIIILNEDKKTTTALNKQNGFSDNFIQGFTEENGKLWVSSFGGLDIIDEAHKTMEHTGKKEGLLSDSIYAVIRDSHNNIWLTGPSAGVEMIDSARNNIRRLDKTNGLSDNTILDVKEDNNGRIWLAHQYSGVDIIDPKTWTVQNLNNAPGLRDTCFRNLMPDKYGRMWIGTNKGIYVADIKHGTLTSISTKEGLSNNYISSMVEYNDYVIAGTYNSGNIITLAIPGKINGNWNVSRLAKSEGLGDVVGGWDVNIVTQKGQYLWGDQGITIINKIKKEQDSAATYITGLSIMNEPQNFANKVSINQHDTLWTADSFYVKGQRPRNTGYEQQGKLQWDSVSGPYNMPVNLQIPYNQNYIQFQFAQANLGRQDSVLYSYILQGIDKKWSPISEKYFTDNYLNLPSGEYTFKVRSRGLNGKWSAPALFEFTILPPWYKTWWAYLVFALIIIGLLRTYIVFRSRRLKKENKILEEKVKYRTEQLEKSLEDLKSTQSQLIQSEKMASLGELTAGIAHEIQNPLNFVNNFSEVNTELADELKEELNKTNLSPEERLTIEEIANDIKTNQEKISFHGKRADSIVKGMLQHSRSSNGQKEPTNINTLADEYLRLAYHGLRAKDKSFNADMKTDFDESISKINIVAQDVGRVILNLITNAFYVVKAAKPLKGNDYEPTVWVSTKKQNGKILVKVRDNGTGIPDKIKDKIFNPFFTTKPAGEGTGLGLSLSYDIIKAHGGKIVVDSKEGVGTEFTVELPVA